MFNSFQNNKTIIEGAYRKLKSYYYYNKNFVIMRKKLVDFESDSSKMEETFSILANYLLNPERFLKDIENLLNKIDIIVLPKKFIQQSIDQDTLITNKISSEKELSEVNFFIDMPIELYILDTVLCVCMGKMTAEGGILSFSVYGNTINNKALYFNDEILWENISLFNIYFNKYAQWRNTAFNVLEKNYNQLQDSLLVTMDLKGYYYSIRISKTKIESYFKENSIYNECIFLVDLFDKICIKYLSKLSHYRKFDYVFQDNEYCLPIGLMTSMLIANIYLADFDEKIESISNVSYYGRYVDDILIVLNESVDDVATSTDVAKKSLVESEVLSIDKNGDYYIFLHNELKLQKEKLKIIYIDHTESRALIDLYNDTIRIIPSQMQPIPEWELELNDFDESVYLFDKFTQSNKVRDLGAITIDQYKIGQYFSQLVMKFSNVNSISIDKDINEQIKKINAFLCGGQGLEYYSQWQNYMYFLVMLHKKEELRKFYRRIKKYISSLKNNKLSDQYKYTNHILGRVKRNLEEHLTISYYTAFALSYEDVPLKKVKERNEVYKYLHANLFNHNLVPLPLANYVYEGEKSLLNISISDLPKDIERLDENFKINWSPRFIHYEELMLLYFYYQHNKGYNQMDKFANALFIDRFKSINHIKSDIFQIESDELFNSKFGDDPYLLKKYIIPGTRNEINNEVKICTGNIALKPEDCLKHFRTGGIDLKLKKNIWNIFQETYEPRDKKNKILVLPELFFPFGLIHDLVTFSRKSQIAIVTGLGYLHGNSKTAKNYIAIVLPFIFNGYKNATVFIREKNDYSPIEKHMLAKEGYICIDSEISKYQIFAWEGLDISPLVCFELTDVVPRALLKGNVDIIALSVFNQDTTYFSNIIDATTRDLHCIIVQANTSIYGDSRVTLPYDRDNKDVFKIKGGENDNVMVGTLKIGEIFKYQKEYYKKDKNYIKYLLKHPRKSKKTKEDPNSSKDKPNIKRLSARFKNKRT